MFKRDRSQFESQVSEANHHEHDVSDDDEHTLISSTLEENIRDHASKELKRIKFLSPPSHPTMSSIIQDDLSKLSSESSLFNGIHYEIPSLDTDFITCIGSKGGDMCYLTFLDDEKEETRAATSSREAIFAKIPANRILKKPMSELLEDVQRLRYEEEIKKKARAQTNASSRHAVDAADMMNDVQFSSNSKQKYELLVDKYAPTSYLDLLTDDKTNAEVLKWIKEWDPIVFPETAKTKKIKPTTQEKPKNPLMTVFGSVSSQKSAKDEKNTSNKFNNSSKSSNNATKGPDHRILLISGPPGIGKTTLAHICAKQAGYEPHEVNASDDRSKDKLIPEIQKVTQMQTVFGSKKPKLLILDEIDGVQNSENKSVISEILNMTYPKNKSSSQKDNENSSKTKKTKSGVKLDKKTKKKKDQGIMRPIICICNDHYSPGLKELRQKSKLIIFRRDDYRTDNTQRIVDRLGIILRKESHPLANVGKHELTQFVKDSDNDIRSCLNTIQFMGFHGSNSMKELMTISKDVKSDIFDAMNLVFKTKKIDKSLISKYQENRISLFNSFLSELDKFDSIANGCFENYLSFCSGSSMNDIADSLSFLQWSDMIDVASNRYQERSLQVYRAASLVKFFVACKKSGFDTSNDFIQYPKQQGDAKRSFNHKHNVLKSLFLNCFTHEFVKANKNDRDFQTGGNLLTTSSVKDMATDLVPYLYQILDTKCLSGLNTGAALSSLAHSGMKGLKQMIKSDQERQSFEAILDICLSYGIGVKQTYVNEKYESTLDPPLDEIAFYPLKSSQSGMDVNAKGLVTPSKVNKTDIASYFKKPSSSSSSTSSNSSNKQVENGTSNVLSDHFKKILSSALHFEKLDRKYGKKDQKEAPQKASSNDLNSLYAQSPKHTSAQTVMEYKKRRRSQLKGTISMYLEFHDGMTNSIRRPAKTSEFL
ncbi:hypothetical protein C9374_002458 [Naegleria lovaniensis]|uniref:AAA+ ATPase domain-containing protein n=1 Tax=Naegleria lovaniensis TaxID=51637 RepID=A0AA88GV46_NAELO|nr:uncharacterized protein C9374_002458 [Naegleria lovaniensis]KAG2386714.1 hypothetical protein C9374_002458 [Naegleria lovaniensis]